MPSAKGAKLMRLDPRICPPAAILSIAIMLLSFAGWSQTAQGAEPYRVLKTAKVGGDGRFDYIFADVQGRRLYAPRSGPMGQLMVFDLDTLAPVGVVAGDSSGGATVDPKSHHGFSTTKPVTMWDSKTLQVLKTIDVGGRPDGILFDPYNERIWILSHMPPYATIIDAKQGTVVGTLDLGGAPEQAVSDGKGTVYVNISDKANIAVVDARTLTVKAHYDLSAKGHGGSGLAFDGKHHILFAYYRQPSPLVVILSARDGHIITTLPTGQGVDTVAFNPATDEAVSAETAGSMTFIKESSPTHFAVEQTLDTMKGAKTLTLDTRTNHIFTETAQFEPPPPNAAPGPGGRPARGAMVPGSFTILEIGR